MPAWRTLRLSFVGFMLVSENKGFLRTNTHTHSFNGLFSRTTRVSWYQKDKTNLDFTEARDSEWQWRQLGHMQVCTLLQTDNHASTPTLFFTGRMPFLPPNQQRQSTEGSCWKLTAFQSWRLKYSVIICKQEVYRPTFSSTLCCNWLSKPLVYFLFY